MLVAATPLVNWAEQPLLTGGTTQHPNPLPPNSYSNILATSAPLFIAQLPKEPYNLGLKMNSPIVVALDNVSGLPQDSIHNGKHWPLSMQDVSSRDVTPLSSTVCASNDSQQLPVKMFAKTLILSKLRYSVPSTC
jgi:hypothetical protein